ncbi:MAG: hypothetical protein ACOYN6_06660 [Ignavibacteria bacterium]
MNKALEYIFNWWASRPANIFIDNVTVAVNPKHWMELSWVNFFGLTLAPVILSIVICYLLTNSRGGKFLFRWWMFNIFTSLIIAVLIFVFLKSNTFVGGTMEAPVYWKIPDFLTISRALVGFLQSFIANIIFSYIITRLFGGLITTVQKFNINKVYPLPRLFKAD